MRKYIFLFLIVLLCGCTKPDPKHESGQQVRHVILWTLSDELSNQQKSDILDELAVAVANLESTVPGAVRFDMLYLDKLPSSNCDFMFDFVFENAGALDAFSSNPDHLAAAGIIKPYVTGRTCLDIPVGPHTAILHSSKE